MSQIFNIKIELIKLFEGLNTAKIVSGTIASTMYYSLGHV